MAPPGLGFDDRSEIPDDLGARQPQDNGSGPRKLAGANYQARLARLIGLSGLRWLSLSSSFPREIERLRTADLPPQMKFMDRAKVVTHNRRQTRADPT